MKIKVFITAVLLCFLCGCAYTEPNAQYTVTALGFDVKGEESQAFLQAIDAAGGEQNGQPVTFTVTGSGDNAKEALDDIKTQLSKKPSFKHCQLVLVARGVSADSFKSVLELCRELDISLKTRIVHCGDIEKLLNNDKIASGADLAALVKQNSEHFGYGAHTALFEIYTALLTAEGEFALPVLRISSDKISVNGLLRYKNSVPKEYLTVKESIRYAKEHNVYEGEE